jgi:adiponectin receptor
MYCLLHCEGMYRNFWIACLVLVNSVGIVAPYFPNWSKDEYRVRRALVYLCSSFVSVFPILSYFMIKGFTHIPRKEDNPAFFYLIVMTMQYLAGVFFYCSRFPERFFYILIRLSPGMFDFFGHSHQIWHLFVFTASIYLYKSLTFLIIWKLENEMCL